MKNKSVLLLICLGIIFSSCDAISGASDEDVCSKLEGSFVLQTVDGQELPYTSYYYDDDNNSYVTKGAIDFYETGGWASWLYNDKTINGSTESNTIIRTGNYTCEAGTVRMANEQNAAAGTGEIDGDTFVLGADSGFEYVFKRR